MDWMSAELLCSLPLLLTLLCFFTICVFLTPSSEPLFSPETGKIPDVPLPLSKLEQVLVVGLLALLREERVVGLGVMKHFQGAARREKGVRRAVPG